jgi:hypothetical protein
VPSTCGMGTGDADVVAQMRALRDEGAFWATISATVNARA